MTDDVLIFFETIKSQDKYGVWHETDNPRQVFCRVNSITRSEFYQSGRKGLNPEYEFTVFHGDYHGEKECQFHGDRYSIYRTYRIPGSDDLELYVARKGGTNGPDENNNSQS